MLSIPKYPEQYAQHFPAIFYLLCCASQHHVGASNLKDERVGHYLATWALSCPLARRQFNNAVQYVNSATSTHTPGSAPCGVCCGLLLYAL